MFVETALRGVKSLGIAAQVVPENFYNGANAAAIREALFRDFSLKSVIGFENTRCVWFAAIDSRAKFCFYVAERGGPTLDFAAAFGVNSTAKLEAVRDGHAVRYPVSQVTEFSPDALAIAEIIHPNDVTIVQKLYKRFSKFGDRDPNLAKRCYMSEMHMGNFGNDPDGVPLFEGRMIEAFDYRAKAYVSGSQRKAVWRSLPFGSGAKSIVPQWRVAPRNIPEKVGDRWREYRLGFCTVGGATNQRFLMATLIPPVGPCGHSVESIVFEPRNDRLYCLWLGIVNSICMDYLARKKGSNNMTLTVMDSLPLPRTFNAMPVEIAIARRALRLACAGQEMTAFWQDASRALSSDPSDVQPCEDPEEREAIRAEIDVLVGRDLFCLTRNEMRYLLDPSDILGADCGLVTFSALIRAEHKKYGEFRTRKQILETWDSLATLTDVGYAAPVGAAG
jgi:hypothetical protein